MRLDGQSIPCYRAGVFTTVFAWRWGSLAWAVGDYDLIIGWQRVFWRLWLRA